MPRERCHRCRTILTSEDKYHYDDKCEECECDQQWEDAEANQLIKSAHYKWRAVCFGVRVLWCGAGRARDVLLLKLRNRNAGRSQLQNVRRG